VLVDSRGRTLYLSDQERAAGKVLCATSDCLAIWTPLTVAMGHKPTGPADVAGKLGTVTRPNGVSQVTFRGSPLYTFSFDHSAGSVNGNGKRDSFGGTDFTWHAANAGGNLVAPTSGPSTPGHGYGA
jgi:predicted lipoprotein with Yx(FWY)xxD motif